MLAAPFRLTVVSSHVRLRTGAATIRKKRLGFRVSGFGFRV